MKIDRREERQIIVVSVVVLVNAFFVGCVVPLLVFRVVFRNQMAASE